MTEMVYRHIFSEETLIHERNSRLGIVDFHLIRLENQKFEDIRNEYK